jgi:hypothetical protein
MPVDLKGRDPGTGRRPRGALGLLDDAQPVSQSACIRARRCVALLRAGPGSWRAARPFGAIARPDRPRQFRQREIFRRACRARSSSPAGTVTPQRSRGGSLAHRDVPARHRSVRGTRRPVTRAAGAGDGFGRTRCLDQPLARNVSEGWERPAQWECPHAAVCRSVRGVVHPRHRRVD